MKILWLWLLLVFHFFFSTASGQAVISGYVVSQSGDSLAAATIKLKQDSSSFISIAYTISTKNGFFELITPKNLATAVVEVTTVGYQTSLVPVILVKSKIFLGNIILLPLIKSLPEVVIHHARNISVSGDTVSFRADAFKLGSESNVLDLIKNMPGFKILDNGKIVFNGRLINKVLIEDDDLTGQNYQKLVKSLSANGIESIQVISNYTNNENILSRLQGNNEQVVNIKFKKGFLGQLSGEITASAGYPIRYYETKEQLLQLKTKAKSLTFFQSNGNGILFHDDNEQNQIHSPADVDNVTDIGLQKNPFFATINELNIGSLKLKPVSSNFSHDANSSYYLKPAKKVFIKGNSAVSYDDVSQRLDKYEQVFTPSQTLSFTQQKEITKKNLFHAHSVSVNYLPNKFNQFAFVFKLNSGKATDYANGFLQQSPFAEQLKGRSVNIATKTSYNHIFKSGFYLSSHIEYQKNRTKADYLISPSNFNELLNLGLSAEWLTQDELQHNQRWLAKTSVAGKIKKHHLAFSLSGKTDIKKINNYITFETAGNKRLVNPDSTSNFKLNLSELNWELQDDWILTKYFTLNMSASIVHLHHKAITENNFGFTSPLQKTFLLPGIRAIIKFSDLSRLSFSYTPQTASPQLNFIMQGYTISNINNITKGHDSLQASVTHSIESYYYFFDLLKKGIIFSTSAIYSQRPLMLLPGQQSSNSYTIYQYFPSRRKGSFFSTTTSFEKIIWRNLSRISFESNILKGNTFSILGSDEGKQSYWHIKERIGIKAKLKKLQINGSFEYSTTLQKMNIGVKRQYNTKQLQATADINWQITPRIISETNMQAFWVSPPNQSFDRFVTANTILRCESKNKRSSWGVNATNLFNTKYFSFSNITQTMISEVRYKIMPLRVSAFLRFSF